MLGFAESPSSLLLLFGFAIPNEAGALTDFGGNIAPALLDFLFESIFFAPNGVGALVDIGGKAAEVATVDFVPFIPSAIVFDVSAKLPEELLPKLNPRPALFLSALFKDKFPNEDTPFCVLPNENVELPFAEAFEVSVLKLHAPPKG